LPGTGQNFVRHASVIVDYLQSTSVDSHSMGKPSDLVQGTLDLLILRTISLEPKHGWAIAKRIQQISNEVLQVQQGSLYPALHRLEQQGWIRAKWSESDSGRQAKFYSLTVVLLVAAGLLFKSFLYLRTADIGCPTDHVLTMKYGLPEMQYNTPAKIVAFHESLLERVRHLPGILSAGLVSTPPGGGYEGDYLFTMPEHPSTSFQMQNDALNRTADPGYFRALRIPLLRGRFFTDQERFSRYQYVIVNKHFADQFYPNENPIGRQIKTIWSGKFESYEIIGVVGDTPYYVSEPIRPMMYFPILSGIPEQASSATIVVRTAGDPLVASIPIQQQVAALDPSLPVDEILTLQQILGRSTASQSFIATLILAFATLSLLLAAIGLYGVLSYLVSQRITEIGLRMALGAQRSQVLRLVFADGLQPVLVGLLIGLAGGAAAATSIRSMLYGTSPLDPLVLVTMVGSLLLTALLACAVPAIRASKIEPMQALRTE
jgi:predicted permease